MTKHQYQLFKQKKDIELAEQHYEKLIKGIKNYNKWFIIGVLEGF